MDAGTALELVRTYAVAGRIVVTQHARERMHQRNVKYVDLCCALTSVHRCVAGAGADTWKVTGPDKDGDSLDVVVALEGGVIVVTVF
jgi:hypothetical protein